MPVSHFERLVEKALAENVEAILKAPLGDSHRHAYIKGERSGLEKAVALFKQSLRLDDDEVLS